MVPIVLSDIEVGQESNTLAHMSRKQYNTYQQAKLSSQAYTGHYSQRRKGWLAILQNWEKEPFSDVLQDLAGAASDKCVKAGDKLETSMNEIIKMAVIPSAYTDMIDKNTELFEMLEQMYIKLFVSFEKAEQRRREEEAVKMKEENEEKRRDDEHMMNLVANRVE